MTQSFMSGAGLLIFPGTPAQLLVLLLVLTATAAFVSTAEPYISKSDSRVASLAQWSLVVVVLYGVMQRCGLVPSDDATDSAVSAGLLVGQALVPLAVSLVIVRAVFILAWDRYVSRFAADMPAEVLQTVPTGRKLGMMLSLNHRRLSILRSAATPGSRGTMTSSGSNSSALGSVRPPYPFELSLSSETVTSVT
jgi:hypothetical protein